MSARLWFTAKTRSVVKDPAGTTCSHRPTPSAGGRHPIDILVIQTPSEPTLAIYDPIAHGLADLEVTDIEPLRSVVDEANAVTMNRDGALLLFAASFNRTLAKYAGAAKALSGEIPVPCSPCVT